MKRLLEDLREVCLVSNAMIPRAIHHRRKTPASKQVETEHRSPQLSHSPRLLFHQFLDRRDSEASADFFFAPLDEEPTVTQQSSAQQSLHISTEEARQCLIELNAVLGLNGRDDIISSCVPPSSTLERMSESVNGGLSRRSKSDFEIRPFKSSLKSSSSLKSLPMIKPTVSFSKLDIREYGIALSDHPSCSCGPPIQLGWNYSETKDLLLEDYEHIRSSSRSREDMILSYGTRDYLLREYAGCSRDEIERSIQEVERVKRDRHLTDLWMPANRLTENIHAAVSHMAHMFAVHHR